MHNNQIQHRYEKRIHAVVGVELWHRGERLGRFRTRNLCRGGMFVETGAIRLRPNDLVQVVVDLPRRSHKTAALVVHQSERGVGLTCDLSAVAQAADLSRAVGF